MTNNVNRSRTWSRGDVPKLFALLSERWKADTRFRSDLEKIVLHPSYQQIIGLGPAALPLILEELRAQGGSDWFWALTAIVGEDKAFGAPTAASARRAWLLWGTENVGSPQ